MPKAVYTHSIADASLHESIIRTILTIQKAQHDGKWNTAETLHGIAAAAAYFCQEIVQQLGPEFRRSGWRPGGAYQGENG